MKKSILVLLTIILLVPTFIFAQNKFYFDADYAVFKNVDSASIIELYFAFNQRSLTYVKSSNGFDAMANLDVNIYDKEKDKIIFSNLFGLQSNVLDSTKANLSSKLIGQQNFKLFPGQYTFTLVGFDYNDKSKVDTMKYELSVPRYEAEKTFISEIQLATSIDKSSDTKSIFYKNGLEITPNPNMLYGINLNKLWYYFEIYSIGNEFSGDSIFLNASITDLSNNLLMSKTKREKTNSKIFAEIGNFQTDSLEKGSYLLKLELVDKVKQVKISREKKFFVYNQSKTDVTNKNDGDDFLRSEYVTMKEDRLNEEYDVAIYLRTQTETDDYKKLTSVDEKRKFMYNFWKKRDENPLTPLNEFKNKYFTLVNEANKLFKQGFVDGWKTDRGRIYITYGKPTDIESFPYEADTKGYEIWRYDFLQGGTTCVFIEKQPGSGYYVLEHSTIRGELMNSNWRDLLRKI